MLLYKAAFNAEVPNSANGTSFWQQHKHFLLVVLNVIHYALGSGVGL
jgi:hypothetical protein